jgi:hypothetical protein
MSAKQYPNLDLPFVPQKHSFVMDMHPLFIDKTMKQIYCFKLLENIKPSLLKLFHNSNGILTPVIKLSK